MEAAGSAVGAVPTRQRLRMETEYFHRLDAQLAHPVRALQQRRRRHLVPARRGHLTAEHEPDGGDVVSDAVCLTVVCAGDRHGDRAVQRFRVLSGCAWPRHVSRMRSRAKISQTTPHQRRCNDGANGATMAVVTRWTGRSATALQEAYRDTNEGFARRLDISVSTVAYWHRKPSVEPRTELQQCLDITLAEAPDTVRARFEQLTAHPEDNGSVALRVAIAVVVDGDRVLLVCRRDGGGITWQFPAGVVKPGARSDTVATQETLAETGVHASVRKHLGTRVHPVTNVECDYWWCDYLAGEAENRDTVENVDVIWCPVRDLHRFIPSEKVFGPVLDALEDARDPVQ